MQLIQRVQDILLKPKDTWPRIEAEPSSVASIYKDYLVYLAAIPALAGFVGLSLVGIGGFGVSFRVPIVAGLVNMVVGYVLSLVMVLVLSLVVDALAPTFGGSKNPLNAFKLVAFGVTAGLIGGVFNLLPALAMLGFLVALYSIYLIYTGLPVLMKCPPEKALAYTAVIVVCGVVIGLVVGAVSAMLTPRGGMGFGAAGAAGESVSIKTPGGEINVNTAGLETMAKRMEEASQKMAQAQASGDSAGATQAAAAMMGALAGSAGVPIPAQDLKALLPESIGSLKRESIEAQAGGVAGMAGSSAKAVFADGAQRVDLSITDAGGLGSLLAVANWANVTVDRETSDGVEKVYKDGPRSVREEYRKDGSRSVYSVVLENYLMVEARGEQTRIDALKAVVAALDLGKLGGLKRPAKSMQVQ